MTTTLRPTGPESRDAEGARSRTYDICVNARPVGVLGLAAEGAGGTGSGVGRIVRLTVDEGERRRGRGTVAALAAEEVLRGWGCARAEVAVPAEAEAALPLLDALGYAERNRNMVKELAGLTEPPELPPGSVARAMTEDEFPAWWARGAETYLRSQAERGIGRAEAEPKLEVTRRSQFPDGAASEGTALRVLAHEGVDVGTIWISLSAVPRPDADAWVFDVEVVGERRGEGHGRSLMRVAERECLAAGKPRLGLNVFADNPRAQGLYTSLGYRSTTLHLVKPLL